MGDRVNIVTSVCLLALIWSCSARPNNQLSRRDDEQEQSLPNEDPLQLSEDVMNNVKDATFNEDELERRQAETQVVSTQVSDGDNTISANSKSVTDQINEGIGTLSTNGESISQQTNEGVENLAVNGKSVSNQIGEGVNTLSENAAAVNGQINQGVDTLSVNGKSVSNQIGEGVNTLSENAAAVNGQINEGVENLAVNGKSVSNQINEGVNTLSENAAAVNGQINQGVTNVDDALAAGEEMGQQVSSQVSNGVNGFQDQINKGFNPFQKQGKEMADKFGKGFQDFQVKSKEMADKFGKGFQDFQVKSKDFADKFGKGFQDFQVKSKDFADQVGKRFNTFQVRAKEIADQIRKGFSNGPQGNQGFFNKMPNGQISDTSSSQSSNGLQGGLLRRESITNNVQLPQPSPQQLQQLKEFLSLEINNKDKFAEIFSRMTPDQVQKIRDIVLRIGQQTNNQDLIKFGQCKSPRLSEKGIQLLLGLGQATYERLNGGMNGVTNRISSNLGSQVDTQQVFNQLKADIGAEQDFIQRVVGMIELQLAKAPQVDEAEFSEIQQITQRIKTLSTQVQSQLEAATDISQLNQLTGALLEIQQLSNRIQQKVSAEVLEQRAKEFFQSASQKSTGGQEPSSSDNGNILTEDHIQSNIVNRRELSEEGTTTENGLLSGINSVANQISSGFTSLFGQIASGLSAMTGGASNDEEAQGNIPDGNHSTVEEETVDQETNNHIENQITPTPTTGDIFTKRPESPISNGNITNSTGEVSDLRIAAGSPTLDPTILESENKSSIVKGKKKTKSKEFQIILDMGKTKEDSTGKEKSNNSSLVLDPVTTTAASIVQSNTSGTIGGEDTGAVGVETNPSTTGKPKMQITDFDDFYW